MGDVVSIAKTRLTKVERQGFIDEYGRLQKLVDDHKTIKDRHEQLRGQLASWYDASPAKESFLEEGVQFTLQVGERSMKRTITKMASLFRVLGQKLFLSLCSFPLAAVDTNVPQPRHKEFLDEAQTGPRKLKVIKKLLAEDAEVAA